jgi:uncharacterized membrane protein
MDLMLEWVSFLTRWLHVMAGIAWVGTSFYFNWFDSSVRPATSAVNKENVRGTLEEVHGGSFYYHEQYWPDRHPDRLLVHAWPAKTTFYTGLVLMAVIYWLGASTYLVDPRIAEISAFGAVAISVASIAIGWLFYTWISSRYESDRTVFLIMAVFVIASAIFFTHIFSGRGAFISMGVMLGSFMGLNVIRHIVPNHIAMRRQLNEGQPLNQHNGYLAKRRSQHNNYFSIPVVFCMISNHFAVAYNHALAWLILCLMLFAGWGIRHVLNVYYKHEQKQRGLAAASAIALILAIALTFYQPGRTVLSPSPSNGSVVAIDDMKAMAIVQQHCTVCHAANPSYPGFSAAPQGLVLETKAHLMQNRSRVIQQTFVMKAMPIGNVTQMTDEERSQLAVWFENNK